MRAVAIGGLRDHVVGRCGWRGIAQDRTSRVAEVTVEQHALLLRAVVQLQQDRGRTADMAGIQQVCADPVGHRHRLTVAQIAVEELERMKGVAGRVQRFRRRFVAAAVV
jgi:hypothetical protein